MKGACVGLLLMVLGGFGSASYAQTVTITAMPSPLQSNFGSPNPQGTGAGESATIGAAPFDFSTQTRLSDISSISITMTIIDGDTGTGPNDFDHNSWTLRLDNIDTGILLNGFSSLMDDNVGTQPGDFIRLTITGTPTNVPALLGVLQDGIVNATIFDSTGVSMSNSFRIPNQDPNGNPIVASLSITGTAVPEPTVSALILVAAALAFGAGLRSKVRERAQIRNSGSR